MNVTSKRTWSLPFPVQPGATASAPSWWATCTCLLAISGRAIEVQDLMAQGVMALHAGLTVMRFLPPLVITQDDLSVVVARVTNVLEG